MFDSLLKKAIRSAGCEAEIVSPGDGWQIQAKFKTVIFTVDAEGGTFGVGEPDYDLDDLLWLVEPPSLFVSRLEAERTPKHLAEDISSVKAIAAWLHRSMTARFEQAVKNEEAHFVARFGNELAGFSEVAQDQLALFDVDEKERGLFFEVDGELDSATARSSGAKLFSLCVTPSGAGQAMATDTSRQGRGSALGKAGRPKKVAHDDLEEIGLELMRRKGVPHHKKANWTGEIFAKAVIEKMAERGLSVSRPTVLNKKSLIIEKYKKELSHKHLQKSNNSKIYPN